MSRPAEPAPRLRTRDAIALGLLHGPAELLPISSSGHMALVPWLLHLPYAELDGELRKSFEVALHAGTLAALLIGLRDEVAEAVGALDARGLRVLALSSLAPAAAGLAFEGAIERRLGGPAGVAAGLIAGALVMGGCDVASSGERRHADARAADGLALGLAQACALVPGISRNGATLAAARARGFARVDASVLSRHAALPVIAGATGLRTLRLLRDGLPAGAARGFAAGTAASFAATLASIGIVRAVERDRSLLPFAAYRIALGALVLARLRRARGGKCVACDIDHPPTAAQ
jgi:undecaprenyl-diphosphatase